MKTNNITNNITKMTLAFALSAMSHTAYAQDAAEPAEKPAAEKAEAPMIEKGSLTSVINDSVTFSILTKALKATGLDTTFGASGAFTIFAPADEAFMKLKDGTLDKLMLPQNKEKLRSLLLFHVVAGKVMAADLKDGEVMTMNGEKFTVDVEGDGDIEINEAKVSSPNVAATNGVMHSVGQVLVPSSLDEFADLED